MSTHFVYIWFDRTRKMFYVGQHTGSIDDGYITSSRWFNGEYNYRPNDFRRKVLKVFKTKHESQVFEAYLLSSIKEHEYGKKYYNYKSGKPKGIEPWNKGRVGIFSDEHRRKLSESKKGNAHTKGMKFPNQKSPNNNMNNPLAKEKLRQKATGRKRNYLPDGSWTWYYPTTSVTE